MIPKLGASGKAMLGAPGRANCVLGPSVRFGAVVQLWCGEILVDYRAERADGSPKTHTPCPPLGYPVRFALGVTGVPRW